MRGVNNGYRRMTSAPDRMGKISTTKTGHGGIPENPSEGFEDPRFVVGDDEDDRRGRAPSRRSTGIGRAK